VERAARNVGFEAISNDFGIFPIKSLKLWNVGVSLTDDLFSAQWGSRGRMSLFKKFVRTLYSESAIGFLSHPMLLYNRKKGVRRDLLERYFKFLTYLQGNREFELTEQHKLLSDLKSKHPFNA
jgi:hypothetical protein